MGVFDRMLRPEESVFSNPDALDLDFVPKLLPHREDQQFYIANAIKPLFVGRGGKNILVHGAPGIGKTVSVKRVLMDMDEAEETAEVSWVFVNCWRKNTSYKVLLDIVHQLGYKFTQNLNTDDLMRVVKKIAEKRQSLVFAFDEIDKAEDYDFLYYILEDVPKKTIILITNDGSWRGGMDKRIESRLLPELLEFQKYSPSEVKDILQQRLKFAFYEDVWDDAAFDKVATKAAEFGDVRVGVTLLKASGERAEAASSRKVTEEYVSQAIDALKEIKIRSSDTLTDDEKLILRVCKEHTGKKTGELYEQYKTSGGDKSLRTFQRSLQALANKKVIELKATREKGSSSEVVYKGSEMKLTDF